MPGPQASLTKIDLLPANGWTDYALLDCGDGEKLERFGTYVLARPEPQALWSKALPASEWHKAHATFRKDPKNPDKGQWHTRVSMPEHWVISYPLVDKVIKFKISLSSFKHVGIFPEQADNWEYIYRQCMLMKADAPKVLNLFAYTGGASLAAAVAGAQVTHVDSVKQVLSWARANAELTGVDGIRWMADDAAAFAEREVRRGNKYHGIILDPPAYGRGPDGEKWLLDDHLPTLMHTCKDLLAPDGFLVLNMYSMGYSTLVAGSLVQTVFDMQPTLQCAELCIQEEQKRVLPLGIVARFGQK